MNRASKLYHAGTLTYTKAALAILCVWLLWGDFCFMLMETVVPSIMPLKFKSMGAPNAIIGMAMLTIPQFLNFACNPIISVRSDRTRSRWGRRIPYIAGTLPFLLVCLFALGFSDKIGFWLHAHCFGLLARFSAPEVAVVVMAVSMTFFSFFNTFVNSVFWYLFNDVVPEELMGRFMSWFRVASVVATAFYGWFIFKYAGAHSTGILCGIAILYFVGFGLMCLNVKEGEYPPPESYEGGESVLITAVKTYTRECLGVSHYWFLFLANMGLAIGFASSLFSVFLNTGLGLTYEQIGHLSAIGSVASMVWIPLSGWLADRWHPMRVVMVGVIMQVLISPIEAVWLFWHPSISTIFYFKLLVGIFLASLMNALVSIIDPVLAMRIYPRDRYGQFCSANAMLRSVGAIIAGTLVGWYLDLITAHYGQTVAYRCLPFWNLAAACMTLICVFKLYGSWKRLGGDDAYVPPGPQPAPVAIPEAVGEGREVSMSAGIGR